MIELAVDVSEFIVNPISTGIQRVVRQLIRFWPEEIARTYVLYVKEFGGFMEVSPSMLVRFMAIDNSLAHEDVRKLAALLIASMPRRRIPLAKIRKILVPEVFFDAERLRFYREVVADGILEICMIVYDYKPFTNPAVFRADVGKAIGILPYLSLTRLVQSRAFISAQTARDFSDRIMRSKPSGDPVIRLGSDSLDLEKQRFSHHKKDILCIGTFEGKKHQEIVFEAFRSVSHDLGGMRLVFAGYVPEDLAYWLRDVVAYQGPDVVVVRAPTDEELTRCFRTAAATIFVSTNEGFGLPAVESLHLGIPVIVYEGLPSVEELDPAGQMRISSVDLQSVRTSLLEIANPARREVLWQEASTILLPTWTEYACRIAAWAATQH